MYVPSGEYGAAPRADGSRAVLQKDSRLGNLMMNYHSLALEFDGTLNLIVGDVDVE